MDAWRQRVIDEAVTWLRTPWAHAQAVKGAGVDCAQLLRMVYVDAGVIEPFETGSYPPDLMLHSTEERFASFADRYMDAVSSPQPGDAVLWKFGRSFSHGGIVIEWPRFIHAYRPENQVCYGDDRDQNLTHRDRRFYMPKVAI